MVSSHSEAVRPSLNVATQEESKENGLGHLGDTAMDVESESKQVTASSTNKAQAQTTFYEQEEHEGKDEDEEEGQEPVTRRAPKAPTKEEREKHEATHLPFREWCDHCVRGRARNKPHKKTQEGDEEKEAKLVRVSMDSFL